MLDKSVNRERVEKWRKKMHDNGMRSLTVYLDSETVKKLKSLRLILPRQWKMSKILTTAIQALYEKVADDQS